MREPPDFPLGQLDKLLATKCAEDDAGLARRGISLDDSAMLAALYAREVEPGDVVQPAASPVAV